MSRKIIFGCLFLLLSGLGMGVLSGCIAEDAELAEKSWRRANRTRTP